MATRVLAVGERLHHLKVFFSNRFIYAQVLRKTDGHVSEMNQESPTRHVTRQTPNAKTPHATPRRRAGQSSTHSIRSRLPLPHAPPRVPYRTVRYRTVHA